MNSKTDQELFWESEFGDNYAERNSTTMHLEAAYNKIRTSTAQTKSISSVLEFGTNTGNNLSAFNRIDSSIQLYGIEINKNAYTHLEQKKIATVYNESILEFNQPLTVDLTMTSGVLIHIPEQDLKTVYDKLYKYSLHYILMIEYFNPTPVSMEYRGHQNKLFKRDFAGEFMDIFPNVKLVDYGFFYSRDPKYPVGSDANWFLMSKKPHEQTS